MHCFAVTLPIVIPAIFLHNFRLNPGKGKGEENLKSEIKKKRRKKTTPKSQKKSEKMKGGEEGNKHKYTDNEIGEAQKRLEKEGRK